MYRVLGRSVLSGSSEDKTSGAVPVLWSGAGSTTSRVGGHQLYIKNPSLLILISVVRSKGCLLKRLGQCSGKLMC